MGGGSRMSVLLRNPLCNTEWLVANEKKIKAFLPDTWTHAENLNELQLGYKLKLLGIDWRSELEFGTIMLFLEKIGILQRKEGFQVRANPKTIFK